MTSSFYDPLVIAPLLHSFAPVRDLGVLFAANSGADTSTLIGFLMVGQTLTATTDATIGLSPQQQLQPLRQADLTLVSTLLPVSVQVTPADTSSANLARTPLVATDGLTAISNPPGRGNGPTDDLALSIGQRLAAGNESVPLGDGLAALAIAPSAPPWEKYVSGVDEAIEQLQRETVERATPSPSAAEASATSPGLAGGEFTGPSSIDRAVAASSATSFEPNSLVSLPGPVLAGTQSGQAPSEGASPPERTRVMLNQRATENLDLPGENRTDEHERGRGRSIGLSVLLVAAAISPSAFGKWRGSIAGRRRARSRRGKPTCIYGTESATSGRLA
jgi:hypothetical protein